LRLKQSLCCVEETPGDRELTPPSDRRRTALYALSGAIQALDSVRGSIMLRRTGPMVAAIP
jgi:hypothetical protein